MAIKSKIKTTKAKLVNKDICKDCRHTNGIWARY